MSEPTGYCPNCKKQVEFLIERGSLYCPDCWNKIEKSDADSKTGNKKEDTGLLADLLAVLRVAFIFILVLAGVFLVLLAFLYAECSHMGSI